MILNSLIGMTRLFTVAVMGWAILTNLGCQRSDAVAQTPNAGGNSSTQSTVESGVAVVELFTSEGCSSCPPAEAELARLSESSKRGSRTILALAFHVDYWNNLGWTDPFSNSANSRRQSQYANALGLDQIYTPQMIVNGKTQFIGSDRTKADQAIEAALKTPYAAKLDLSVSRTPTGEYRISYSVTGAGADDFINVAVIERGLVSVVRRGENAGRTLEDPNVVRWFKSETTPENGRAELRLPLLPDVHFDHASVIAYVQHAKEMAVVGAASAQFPK